MTSFGGQPLPRGHNGDRICCETLPCSYRLDHCAIFLCIHLFICHPRLPGDQAAPSFGASGQAPRPRNCASSLQPFNRRLWRAWRVRRLLPLLSGSCDRWPTQAPLITGAHETAIAARENSYITIKLKEFKSRVGDENGTWNRQSFRSIFSSS